MRRIYNLLSPFVALLLLTACEVGGEGLQNIEIGGEGNTLPATIAPSCVVEQREQVRSRGGVVTRSLIDQNTTKEMPSNFLRLDEDLNNANNGLYTFTGNDGSTPYHTNWNKAQIGRAHV